MDERTAARRRIENPTPPRDGWGPPRWLGPLGRVPLLLGAVFGLAICLIGALTLTLLHSGAQPMPPAPDTTAQQICTYLVRQDYATLYGLLSTTKQAEGTQAQFAASQRQLDIASGNVTQCAVSVAASGEQASARFTLTRGETNVANGSASLIYARGGWRLDTYDPAVI